jgi:hypothetical protein
LTVGAGGPTGVFAGGSAAEELHAHKAETSAQTIANRLTLWPNGNIVNPLEFILIPFPKDFGKRAE